MRYLIVSIVCILFAVPVVAADSNLPSEKCQNSDFSIVGKNNGADYRYKMNETLKIRVTGGCFSDVNHIVKQGLSKNVVLYLDDIKMTDLHVDGPQIEGDGLILPFRLARDSENESSRATWNKLLSKHRGKGYGMTLPLAIAIGNEPAWLIPEPTEPFQFYIVEKTVAELTIIVCLALFLSALYLLVKSPSALRDEKGGYYSLGKSQMAFWGLLVALAFAGIWFVTGTMEHIPDQVLILIGISGATGLSSVVIGENKKSTNASKIEVHRKNLRDEQKLLETRKKDDANAFTQGNKERLEEINAEISELSQQPAAVHSAGFWRDICNDGNGLSFHRLQVVIWTIILGVVFIVDVSEVISMPEFSNTLLMLMGISSGTYLGFKIPEKV